MCREEGGRVAVYRSVAEAVRGDGWLEEGSSGDGASDVNPRSSNVMRVCAVFILEMLPTE